MELARIDQADHWSTMLGVAQALEDSGFESGWVFDHFHTIPIPSQEVTYEAWTLMSALAASTDSLRLGQMCTCNGYRAPSYLAKVAASIDVISDGRLEMGIGGGWYEEEFLGYGYKFPKPAVRLGELDEAVQIMQRMWTEDEVFFEGRYYQLQGAICQPKPVQVPHVPIWVAGGGEQLTLRTAARYASHTNFGLDLESFIHKSEVLAKHCAEQGTDVDEIVRSSNFTIAIGETTDAAEDKMAWLEDYYTQLEVPEENTKRQVGFIKEAGLWGSPDRIISDLKDWEAAGLTYAILFFPEAPYDRRGIELFAKEIIPAFR